MLDFNRFYAATILLGFFLISSCNKTTNNQAENISSPPPKVPVEVGYVTDTVTLSDDVTLNATATYLLKSDVKANTIGYITRMSIKLGDPVRHGEVLFGLQTKEARALGNTINKLDSTFSFNGNTVVISPASGYVVMINHQVGDYVQDGEILATITDATSFGFVMDVPYEYLQIVKGQKNVELELPDGRKIRGVVSKIMPSVDPVSQTVKVLLKILKQESIPENLIGTVTFSKEISLGLSVPKEAVLSNETQSSFWVMKLLNDTTAVKEEIEKGLETNKFVEVKSGNLAVSDLVLLSGNFGLGDTAVVNIKNILK